MPVETVIGLLGAAAKSAILETVTKKVVQTGTESILRWASDLLASQGEGVTRTEWNRIERLIGDDESVVKRLVAQMKPADRNGILVVGPSGGGKTRIINALANRTTDEDGTPTVSIDKYFAQLGGTITAIRDAPGTAFHGSTIWPTVRKHSPKVLVVVLASGFLDSAGTGDVLKRPVGKPAKSLVDYIAAAQKEELEWLQVFTEMVETGRKRTPYLVIAINKMDLWAEKYPQVLDHYQTGAMAESIKALEQKLLQPNRVSQLVTLAANYNSFKSSLSPHPRFNKTVANDSVKLFKAYLASLMVDGAI